MIDYADFNLQHSLTTQVVMFKKVLDAAVSKSPNNADLIMARERITRAVGNQYVYIKGHYGTQSRRILYKCGDE